MQKRKLLRSAAAMGMAAALMAVPVCAFAESTDEQELVAGLEEKLVKLGDFAVECGVDVEFGDGLYDLAAQDDSADLSWLKDVSGFAKAVHSGESADAEILGELNGTPICKVLVAYDNAADEFYLSIPDYFEQAIAINPQDFAKTMMSGGSGENGGMNMIMQIVTQTALELVGQMQEFFYSIPQEAWQEELSSYLTPVLSNLVQESGQETITVADLSADVQTQTLSIPSEKMGEVITSLLNSLSNDKVIEAFLQSDAVSGISSLVSMLTGGSVNVSGEALLGTLKSAVDGIAQSDFSGVPGIVIKIMTNEDQTAMGYSAALEMGGQTYDMYTVKAIMDGDKHAYEVTPGAMYLSMCGINVDGTVDLLGQGSTEGGMLNEEVNLYLDDKSIANLAIKDLDLVAMTTMGYTIGTLHMEFGGMTLDLEYDVTEDGARTIDYMVNDKLFYHAAAWGGAAKDANVDLIDKDSALRITSVDDLTNWLGTFNSENLKSALEQAGVPTEQLAA